MSAGKRYAWLLSLLFGGLFVFSAWPMAQRIQAFNVAQHVRNYHVEPVKMREIRIPGFPAAKLDDSTDESGRFAIKLTYGDPSTGNARTLFIPVNKPPVLNVSDLGIYEEWLRVLAINEVVRDSSGDQSVGSHTDRLTIVVRRTPEGYETDTWGSVRRTEWLFDFYELKPDGTIVEQVRRWPMAKDTYEQAFQERAAAAAKGDATHPPDDRLARLAAIPPLQQRTAEYLAALYVIPKMRTPTYKFTDTAFSPHVLGWTLPVSMLAGLGFIFAFFFAVAPSRIAGAPTPSAPAGS